MTVSDYNIEKARNVNLIKVLLMIELPHKKESGHLKINCLWHEERSPSCAIYEDHYYCFGCEAHGDAIDFVQKVYNVSFAEAVNMLSNL